LAHGCLQPPVTDHLTLRFLDSGRVIVSAETRLQALGQYEDNPDVQRRIADAADALRRGDDAWSARLALGEPSRLRFVLDETEGSVARVVRHAELPAANVRQIF